MKCYGYDKIEFDKNVENDSESVLRELAEISILAKPEHLRLIASFLNYASNQIELHGNNFGHEHFRDYAKDFKKGDCDIIVSNPDPAI
jgi:hypothetical protein